MGSTFYIHYLTWHIKDLVIAVHKRGLEYLKTYSHFPSIGNNIHNLRRKNVGFLLQTYN